MAVPYPPRGSSPWDLDLKAYIDDTATAVSDDADRAEAAALAADGSASDADGFAQAANDSATDAINAAASINREQANGVAGLDASGKVYESRLPDRLSEASIDADIAAAVAPKADSADVYAKYEVDDAISNEADRTDAAIDTAMLSVDPFVYDSTRLRRFRVAMADALNNPVDILCVGDSTTEGYGATTIGNRWENQLLARLRDYAGVAGGGEGYVPAFYETSGHADRFTGGTFTTSGSLFGLGIRCIVVTAGTVSFTFNGTGCDILFAAGPAGGQFTWSVDGGAASPTNSTYSTNTEGGFVYISARGLASGSHTININRLTSSLYIEGAMVYDGDEGAGIRLLESGHSGYQAYSYAVTPYWSASVTPIAIPWTSPVAVQSRVDPALAIIMLGLNDYATGGAARRTAAQFKADLKTTISLIRADVTIPPSIVLVIPWERTTTGTLLSTWEEYRAAYHEVAQEDGEITLVDLKDTIGNFNDGDPYDLDTADGLHLNNKGYKVVSEAIYRVLI